MTDLHAQLEAWLADGHLGDTPRETAVHASVCERCTRALGAFDTLALIDVGAAGSPPPLAARSRLYVGMAWARVGTALTATVLAGLLVGFGISQLVGLGEPASAPAGEPEGTELAGMFAPSNGVDQSQQPSEGATAGEAPTPTGVPTPLPGVTPGPQPPPAPGATPRPPTPRPSATSAPTPPPTAAPTPPPTAAPTPTATTEPTPTPAPTPTAPGAPSSLTAQPVAGAIELNWAPPTDDGGSPVTGYEIWRSNAPGFETFYAAIGNQLSYQDVGVASGETWFYVVRAFNAIGPGPFSNEAFATML